MLPVTVTGPTSPRRRGSRIIRREKREMTSLDREGTIGHIREVHHVNAVEAVQHQDLWTIENGTYSEITSRLLNVFVGFTIVSK